MGAAPRPLRADAERNRRRILDAGREVFASGGLTVGIDAVARHAGVGVGTIYRRFPTKDDLLAAIVDDILDGLSAALDEVAGIEDTWAAFAAAADVFAGQAVANRSFFDALQEDPSVAGASELARRRALEAIEPVLARARGAGVVRDDAVALDLLALWSNTVRLPRQRLEQEPGLWRRYLAIVLDGLRPEAAHALPHPPGRNAPPSAQDPARAL